VTASIITAVVEQVDHTAAYATTASAVGVAVVGAIASVYINRNGRVARKVDSNVGETNGQGTLAEMVARIDTRTTTMDSRLARHESATNERFDGLHHALTELRERITHVEDEK
jgi:mannose/fructose/N-acetylgalactosamine-specific phosphotransferase system component IID